MHESGLSRCSQLDSCALWRILDTTRHLAAPLGVDEILHKTIASALEVLNAERGSVFLYDSKTNELFTKVTTGEGPDGDATTNHVIRFPADRGIAGETAQTRKLINVPDCYADPRFNRDVDRRTGFVTRCMLSVPLLGVDNALVGVLQVLNKHENSFDEEDSQIAMTMAAHCAVVLQRAMLLEEYVIKQKMDRDLALARQIQMGALPKSMPELPGYEFVAWSNPADETGGDIYDAVTLGEDRVALLMGDATGHGIGPALSVAEMRSMFRMGLLLGGDLGDIMSRINFQLSSDLPSGRFITAFAGIVNNREHRIAYHSAGQAPLLHYHALEGCVEWLEASTLPLGLFARAPMFAPRPVEMAPGDIFALISDGFYEYADASGEQFGKKRMEVFFQDHCRTGLEEMRRNLCASVQSFAAGAAQEDDMTVVLVRRNP
jgi:phosphoserine phosphatase RsbU/P